MMKKLLAALIPLAVLLAPAAHANDTKMMMKISEAMDNADTKSKLDPKIKFVFGKADAGKVAEKLGPTHTSQKANSFGKSNDATCQRAFANAILQLQKDAQKKGADAVVGLVSNYKNIENSSETEYECHVGAVMSGVALKGELVKLK